MSVVVTNLKEAGHEKAPLTAMSTALLFPHFSEQCSVYRGILWSAVSQGFHLPSLEFCFSGSIAGIRCQEGAGSETPGTCGWGTLICVLPAGSFHPACCSCGVRDGKPPGKLFVLFPPPVSLWLRPWRQRSQKADYAHGVNLSKSFEQSKFRHPWRREKINLVPKVIVLTT